MTAVQTDIELDFCTITLRGNQVKTDIGGERPHFVDEIEDAEVYYITVNGKQIEASKFPAEFLQAVVGEYEEDLLYVCAG